MRVVRTVVISFVVVIALVRPHAQLESIVRHEPALPVGAATLSGQVVSAGGEPIAGAHVSVKAVGFEAVERDADGRGQFAFSKLPEKAVELRVTAPGWLDASYGEGKPGSPGTPIRLVANRREQFIVRMYHGAAIEGVVSNDRGEPVPGITVWPTRLEPLSDGEVLQLPERSAETGSDGRYRVDHLIPGQYLVFGYRKSEMNFSPAPAVASIETGLFYPDANDASSAEHFSLREGEDRADVNLHLHVSPATTIRGVVRWPGGEPCANASIELLRPHEPIRASYEAFADRDGQFELTRILAGEYDVVVFGRPIGQIRGAAPRWARAHVVSDGRTAASLDVVLEEAGATITGRIVFEGRASPPVAWSTLHLFAGNMSGSQFFDVPSGISLDADGRFTIAGVPPSRFRLGISELPAGWIVKAEVVDGHDLLDVPLEIRSSEIVSDVVVTLTDRPTELAGTVLDARSNPSAAATVVIFSSDARDWTPRSRRVVLTRPDTVGQFSVTGLPAGEYVVALTGADLFGRPDSTELARLRSIFSRVTLRDGEHLTQVAVRRPTPLRYRLK